MLCLICSHGVVPQSYVVMMMMMEYSSSRTFRGIKNYLRPPTGRQAGILQKPDRNYNTGLISELALFWPDLTLHGLFCPAAHLCRGQRNQSTIGPYTPFSSL